MYDPKILGLPPTLSADDQIFHKKLVEGINNANTNLTQAHAQVFQAEQGVAMANQGMATWVLHLTEKYQLKSEDVVDVNGTFGYNDINWAIEAQAKARYDAENSDTSPMDDQEEDSPVGEPDQLSDEHQVQAFPPYPDPAVKPTKTSKSRNHSPLI